METAVRIARFVRYPPGWAYLIAAWLVCVIAADAIVGEHAAANGTKTFGFVAVGYLSWHYRKWRARRLGMYEEKGLDAPSSLRIRLPGVPPLRWTCLPIREVRLVGRYLAERYRIAVLKWWRWPQTVENIEGLTGGWMRMVPPLYQAEADVNNHVHAVIKPGAFGALASRYMAAAPEMAGYIRQGCLDVLVETTPGKPGDATVEFAYSDPFDAILDLEDLPWPTAEHHLTYGIRRDGSPAMLDYLQSVLIGGLTRHGKSVQVKVMVACLIRLGVPFELYVGDLKDGIEFHEYAAQKGIQNGCMKVAEYETDAAGVMRMFTKLRAEMTRRAAVMKESGTKQHIPTPEEPLLIALIDETIPLRGLLKADSDPGVVAFTGAGRAVVLWLNAQLGEKSILGEIRDLIPQRLCFAVQTYQQTDMILGDGAHNANAYPHKLGELRGVGYSGSEGDHLFKKFRAANVTPQQGRDLAEGKVPPRLLVREAVGAAGSSSRSRRADKRRKAPVGAKRAWLYRAYDDDPKFMEVEGTNLAYIGKHYGRDPETRYRQHAAATEGADIKWCNVHRRKENVWLLHAKRIEVVEVTVRFGNVERELLRQEKLAIETEFPVFNVQHNRGSVLRRKVKAFLSRGAVKPAEEPLPDVEPPRRSRADRRREREEAAAAEAEEWPVLVGPDGEPVEDEPEPSGLARWFR